MRVPLSVALILLGSACSKEDEIKDAATWLCLNGQIEALNMQVFPDGRPASTLVDADDLKVAGEQAAADAAAPYAALGEAVSLRLIPAAKAAVEARAKYTTCTVKAVTIEGDSASAVVDVVAPISDQQALSAFGTLADLPTREARVAEAEKWFKDAKKTDPQTVTAAFRRGPEGWRRFYDQRAARDAAEKKKKAKAAGDEVKKLIDDGDVRAADTALKLALTDFPDDPMLKVQRLLIDDALKSFVAGDWRLDESKNAMTDDQTVVVVLNAKTKVSNGYSEKRPSVVARCRERRLDLYVNAEVGIRSDYGEFHESTSRVRFGTDKAEATTFNVSDSGDAVFFRGAAKWLKRLAESDGKELTMEFKTYRSTEITTFDLTGAATALSRVAAACSLKL